MKILSAVLLFILAGLQYQIWFGQSGAMAQQRLAGQVAEQRARMEQLAVRNRKMTAEVLALQAGNKAFESRARSELGLVKKGEVFYLIADESNPYEASAAADSRPLAAIKSQPEDWRVHEHLGWPFAGYGEHLYLYIEKRNLNTAAVAGELIKRYGVRPQDIGFAGLKDKHGITRQWFSITTPSDSIDEDLRSTACRVSDEYIVCLQAARHTHKLRRGSHVRNDFVINFAR